MSYYCESYRHGKVYGQVVLQTKDVIDLTTTRGIQLLPIIKTYHTKTPTKRCRNIKR